MSATLDCDVTFVVRTRDDEERVGHVLRRIASWSRAQGLRSEILVADEGSGDNTVAIAVMLRPSLRELTVMHCEPGEGFRDGAGRARGSIVVLTDARLEAPLAPLGYAFRRIADGMEVVALGGRYLLCRRTRAWRAFDVLVTARRGVEGVERRFVRRARQLDLAVVVTHRPRGLQRLLRALRPMPLALRS